jgi:glycosyltransferase involved in cell wall biosynthesis
MENRRTKRIWLINPYGPIPGEGWRDYRFTLLGRKLAERGNSVTWWTATYSHHFKRYRSDSWKNIEVGEGFNIVLVPTSAYLRNIGVGRLCFEAIYSLRLYRNAFKNDPPDCIVGVDPPQTVGFVSGRIARRFNAKFILDIFDLWPELFVLAFPDYLRWTAPVVLYPFAFMRKFNLQRACAVTALCRKYLDVAHQVDPGLAKRRSSIIYNGIDVEALRSAMKVAPSADSLLRTLRKEQDACWAIYAGSLGHNYDIPTLLSAAELLSTRGIPAKIIIAGDGPLRELIENFIRGKNPKNLCFVGKLNHLDLGRLYKMCDVGLCAYGGNSNVAMPDKAYDYMAAGLPIINSLGGEFAELLRERDVGIQYLAGNPEALANALEALWKFPERRRQMAHNSYVAAMDYDQNRQYGTFADLVEEFVR